MKTIQKGYYYLFYKLYKWIGEDNWWSDWKAALSVDVLIYFIVITFFIYLKFK
jgi:hypothetical protein